MGQLVTTRFKGFFVAAEILNMGTQTFELRILTRLKMSNMS